MRASLPCLVLAAAQPCLAGLAFPQDAGAQEAAALQVTVLTAESQPLEGALVAVRGTPLGGVTDRRGVVRFSVPGDGVLLVEVQYIGYAPVEERVTPAAGRLTDLLVELLEQPIGLAALDVEGASNLVRRGFFERRRAGSGTFLTRAEIDEMRPRYLSDVLRRVSGVHVGSSRNGLTPTRIRGQQTIVGSCPVQYFVDGVVTTALSIDEVRPEDIDGIEVYRGSATIPAVFKRGTATCGVIVLWTKLR